MEQHAEEANGQLDNKKCYNCGKVFRTPANLLAHKKRKTPCLIRNVTEEQKLNPNRCIFCNKIFSKKENLTRHLKSCKIKNGGMEILVDKVRYEQEIRIMREQFEIERKAKDTQIQKLTERLDALEQSKAITQQIINTVNNYNAPINITINNYTQPTLEGLKITADELNAVTKLSKFLLQKMYFNPDLPQNHCMYLQNRKDKTLILFADNNWNMVMGDNVSDVIRKLSDTVYVRGTQLINGANGPYAGEDNKYLALPAGNRGVLEQFNTGIDSLTRDDAYEVFLGGRDIVLSTIKAAGCKLV